MSSGNQLPNLEKIFRDDDKPDFLQSGGSNLAAIFGVQTKGQDSLVKHNHKKTNAARNPIQTVIVNKPEVIIAKVVHAFKLQNGSYFPVGKLGMALTGNIISKMYQIILYKSKQEHKSVVTLTNKFVYTVQPNNYSSYYDSNKDNWSILFENNDVCIEFAREIGLARYFSRDGKLENVLYQDLTPISKDAVAKEGDKICIKYYIATDIVQPFKSNTVGLQSMTVEISSDENWERILLGADKGLKRVLFLPSTKQISLGPGFPKEKDVLLEIEIIDIQVLEDCAPKTGSGKASLISRMAKMGQPILPKTPACTTTDSEDTEEDVPQKSPRQKAVELLEEPLLKKNLRQESSEDEAKTVHKILKVKSDMSPPNIAFPKPLVSASAFASQWSPTQLQPNYVTLDGQMYSLQQQTITPTMPAVIDPSLNMLLSETRMTNTELRMGMSKIADNVQKLLDKFHVLELQNAVTPTSERATMDATLKMLLAINAAQTGIKTSESKMTNTVNNDNLSDYNEMKQRLIILNEELRESREKILKLETTLENTKEALKRVKDDLEAVEKLRNKKENNLKISKTMTECCTPEQSASSAEERNSISKNKEVKHIMNQTYQILLSKFVDKSYTTDYIKLTIANTIKNITLQVLYEGNDTTNNEAEDSESTKIDTKQDDACPSSSFVSEPFNQTETTEGLLTNITSTIQDEPPPIPPNDTDIDNDWLE